MQLYIGTYLCFRLIWSNKFQAFKEIVQRKKKNQNPYFNSPIDLQTLYTLENLAICN